MYFLPLHAVLSKGVSYAHVPAMRPAGSNPGVDAICRLSLLLVLSLSPGGFSPGTSVFPSPLKPTFSNSNSIWNARTRFNEFLRTLKCSVEAGDYYYQKDQPSCVIHVIEIQPVDSAIHRLNNYCLVFKCFTFFFFEETTARNRPEFRCHSPQVSPTPVYSPGLYLSFIQVLSSASQDIDLRCIFSVCVKGHKFLFLDTPYVPCNKECNRKSFSWTFSMVIFLDVVESHNRTVVLL